MRKLVSITFNGKTFTAYPGDVLLDAALRAGVGMPHDCRSGDCEVCVVRVVSGVTRGGDAGEPGMVRACEARVMTDVVTESEEISAPVSCRGTVVALNSLSDAVTEVIVEPARPLSARPGQYVHAEFKGFPKRPLTPTRPLDARADDGLLRFHIEKWPGGSMSAALGTAIKEGHRVDLTGPFGSAYFRRGLQNRLVLVAGGAGFAPIWSIADAALRERPQRSMLVLIGASTLKQLYMVQALGMMVTCPNVRVVVTCEEAQTLSPVILAGKPTDYLPPLLSRDVVYAAGTAALVDAVAEVAAVSGSAFYGEAFLTAAEDSQQGWLSRVLSRAGSGLTESKARVPSRSPVPLQPPLEALPHPGKLSLVRAGGQASRPPPLPGAARAGGSR